MQLSVLSKGQRQVKHVKFDDHNVAPQVTLCPNQVNHLYHVNVRFCLNQVVSGHFVVQLILHCHLLPHS